VGEAGSTTVAVRPITSAETHPLRLDILRPDQPPESAVYPGDDDPTTRHFGAFVGDRMAGIASLYAEGRTGGQTVGWRLRGMATEPAARRRGLGRALLNACVEHVAAAGGGELWANARMVAVDFYVRDGFDVVSEQFDIPGIGPHVVVRRFVPGARASA
jgi:GNAT superfamily N-acetyltransferase